MKQLASLPNYLNDLPELEINTPVMQQLIKEIESGGATDEERIMSAFEFVRDKISHSWDIQAKTVTKTATEVLSEGHGICYAKSNLLAALLRGMKIPTGFCYQRLLLFDEETSQYCIHALNAVYLKERDRWLHLDARGNKHGIQADFTGGSSTLAFNPDESLGEKTYDSILTVPHSLTMETLDQSENAIEMYLKKLPEMLPIH